MDTILIIDDDEHLRKGFERMLTEEGYSVKSASSGEAGIEIVHANVPDLVILDVRLPGINGLQAFKIIHEMEPKLPVIIMTGYGTTETAIEATKMGAFDYILKPFDIPDMLSQVKQALEANPCRMSTKRSEGCPPQTLPSSSAGNRARGRNWWHGPFIITA